VFSATAASAVIGAMLAVTSLYDATLPEWDVAGLVLAVVSAIVAVAMNLLPFGNWEKDHRDFMRQWNDLREDIETLRHDCIDNPSCVPSSVIKKLDAKMHRICGQEPSPNKAIIATCFKEE
jgi:hypothetical protein